MTDGGQGGSSDATVPKSERAKSLKKKELEEQQFEERWKRAEEKVRTPHRSCLQYGFVAYPAKDYRIFLEVL
jgi:hypothetical protein